MNKHWGVYPDKRVSPDGTEYYVLIQFTGAGRRNTQSRYWPPALEAPRKPRRFGTYHEAAVYRESID